MIGTRLHRARLGAKLSLRALSALTGHMVSAQAIGRYENNAMMPSSPNLLALAKALDISPEYLLSNDGLQLEGVEFRRASSLGAKLHHSIESKIVDQVQRQLEIEQIIELERPSWKPPRGKAFTVTHLDDAENAANALRMLWSLGNGPIASMASTLEANAVKLVLLDLPSEFSGTKVFVTLQKRAALPVIVLNKNKNAERQRFTYAHELAHLVLKFPVGTLTKFKEKASDRFAGALLVNKHSLTQLLGGPRSALSFGELFDLKREFRVSVATLVVRCRQTELISQALYNQLWAEIKNAGLNDASTQEPHPISPDIPGRLERMCFFAVSEQLISESKAAEALQISARELSQRMSSGSPLTNTPVKHRASKLVSQH